MSLQASIRGLMAIAAAIVVNMPRHSPEFREGCSWGSRSEQNDLPVAHPGGARKRIGIRARRRSRACYRAGAEVPLWKVGWPGSRPPAAQLAALAAAQGACNGNHFDNGLGNGEDPLKRELRTGPCPPRPRTCSSLVPLTPSPVHVSPRPGVSASAVPVIPRRSVVISPSPRVPASVVRLPLLLCYVALYPAPRAAYPSCRRPQCLA